MLSPLYPYKKSILYSQALRYNKIGSNKEKFDQRCNDCKVFPEVPIVGFRNRKSLKHYLVRAALRKMDNIGGLEPCGKGTYQVCDHILTTNTFTTKACGEVFKIESRPLNCDSEKVLYFLRCKIWDDTPYIGKAKTKFRLRFNNYKSKHRSFRKGKQNVPQKYRMYHRIRVFIHVTFKIPT